MRVWMVVAGAGLLLSGCQSASERAAADESYCTSIGAAPGTNTYAQCRLTLRQERIAKQQAAFSVAAGAFEGAGQGLARAQAANAAAPRPLNCTSSTLGNTVNTTCY